MPSSSPSSVVRPEIVDHVDPIRFVPIPGAVPRPEADDVLVFTLHDGGRVPRHLWGEKTEAVLARPEVQESYVRERDWGADRVAAAMARHLGLSGFLKIDLARMILDFNRFPGISHVGEAYLLRHSLFPPVEHLLTEETIHEVLERYYDGISRELTKHFAGKRLTLGVHTYDATNATGTERPELSLVTRSLSYQLESTIPPYVFDPLFPPIVCETLGDRRLLYGILHELSCAGHDTALDYPYLMPEGSVEIRAQVWFFFRHLRECFEEIHPETRTMAEYARIWQMLQDVTRRSQDAERLRAYLHRFRNAPDALEEVFSRARPAYRKIREFLHARRVELVDGWRHAPERPSSFGLEVRKDRLCRVDAERCVVEPVEGAEAYAEGVASAIARAVSANRVPVAAPAQTSENAPIPAVAG